MKRGETSTHGAERPRALRLLSFNIQAGSSTGHPAHYLTRGWHQLLPHASKRQNLEAIGRLIGDYDIVALQEADGGSLRSGFENQTHHLAELAGFPYWAEQTNRRVGNLAKPSNGVLSRIEPREVIAHALPGAIPGRGVMEVRYGPTQNGLHVYNAHLALTRNGRRQQFEYLVELIGSLPHVVLMGDFNTPIASGELDRLFAKTRLARPALCPPTFPSWRPLRAIDHVLVSRALASLAHEVPLLPISDHLPIALTVALPPACRLE